MTAEKIHIRPATPADRATIVAFNQQMACETEGKTLDAAVLDAGVRQALGDPSRCLYFIAELSGEPVGQTMVTYEWSDWRNGVFWWIQSVYVPEPYRRRGVFRALYAHIREQARNRPDTCGLRLYVHRDNARALETYKKLGMSLTDYLLCEEEWPTSERRA
jgi:GNAT superfamily N-acetyltransferase